MAKAYCVVMSALTSHFQNANILFILGQSRKIARQKGTNRILHRLALLLNLFKEYSYPPPAIQNGNA